VAAAVLFAALATATAVLVSNTLRLAVFARRDEIEIMKLVGATDAFVAAPFLVEGALQGLLGAGLAVLALLALHAAVVPRLAAAVAIAGGLGLGDTLPPGLLAVLLAGGAAVGLVGSALAVRRALRRV
jgi:cell division transport system permease protein